MPGGVHAQRTATCLPACLCARRTTGSAGSVASAETAIDTPMSPAGSVHQSRSRSQGEGGVHSRDRLRDLAALAGASDAGMVVVESLERAGAFASATLV